MSRELGWARQRELPEAATPLLSAGAVTRRRAPAGLGASAAVALMLQAAGACSSGLLLILLAREALGLEERATWQPCGRWRGGAVVSEELPHSR